MNFDSHQQITNIGGDIHADHGSSVNITQQIVNIIDSAKQNTLNLASPYRGLEYFDKEHSNLFFGRKKLTQDLVDEIQARRFYRIIGPSGSGKSSLIRAGVIPEWETRFSSQSKKVRSLIFTPGRDPFDSFAACLRTHFSIQRHSKEYSGKLEDGIKKHQNNALHVAFKRLRKKNEHWFIFIDQFEEIFTSTPESIKNFFIDDIFDLICKSKICHDPGYWQYPSVHWVIAMRVDFMEQFMQSHKLLCLSNGEFGKDLPKKNSYEISKMTSHELAEAITAPAAQHGVQFQNTDNITQIVREVEGESGALPLLQYALDKLWNYEKKNIEKDKIITSYSYSKLGGIQQILKTEINDYWNSANSRKQEVIKFIFLLLVNVDFHEGVFIITSRPELKRVILGNPPSSLKADVLDELIEKRWITSDQEKETQKATVRIAHEILLRTWDQLAEWIKEKQSIIRQKNELSNRLKLWEGNGKRSSDLLRGTQLTEIQDYRQRGFFQLIDYTLTREENEFIDESLKEEERQRNQQRRTIFSLVGFSAFLIIVLIGVIWLWNNTRRQATFASVQEHAQRAMNLLNSEPTDGLVLAIHAVGKSQAGLAEVPVSVQRSLHRAIDEARERDIIDVTSKFWVSFNTVTVKLCQTKPIVYVTASENAYLYNYETGITEHREYEYGDQNPKDFLDCGEVIEINNDAILDEYNKTNVDTSREINREIHRHFPKEGSSLGILKTSAGLHHVDSRQTPLNPNIIMSLGEHRVHIWDSHGHILQYWGNVIGTTLRGSKEVCETQRYSEFSRIKKSLILDFSNDNQNLLIFHCNSLGIFNIETGILKKEKSIFEERLSECELTEVYPFKERIFCVRYNDLGFFWASASVSEIHIGINEIFLNYPVFLEQNFSPMITNSGKGSWIEYISPNGSYIAAQFFYSNRNFIHLYRENRDGIFLHYSPTLNSGYFGGTVGFSENEQYFAVGDDSGQVQVYDLFSYRNKNTSNSCLDKYCTKFQAHVGSVTSIVFNSDNSRILTIGEDKLMKLWTIEGELLGEYKGHKDAIQTATFSQDGKYIVSADVEGDIFLWRAGDWRDWLAVGCERLKFHPVFNERLEEDPNTWSDNQKVADYAKKTCERLVQHSTGQND